MLAELTDGVQTQTSATLESNAVIVHGTDGVLVVDPGLTGAELGQLAASVDRPVVAGFATHPHWDHVLWHAGLGHVPRYGTQLCASEMEALLASENWRDRVAGAMPPEIAGEVPVDELFGRITALPSSGFSWHGPGIRVIEHRGHSIGSAALLVESSGVLVAGDMLSDKFVPMLSRAETAIDDYLDALDLLAATGALLVIPGHGSVGTDVQERIDLDRAYVLALRDGRPFSDPRVETPEPGWEWMRFIDEGQRERYGVAST